MRSLVSLVVLCTTFYTVSDAAPLFSQQYIQPQLPHMLSQLHAYTGEAEKRFADSQVVESTANVSPFNYGRSIENDNPVDPPFLSEFLNLFIKFLTISTDDEVADMVEGFRELIVKRFGRGGEIQSDSIITRRRLTHPKNGHNKKSPALTKVSKPKENRAQNLLSTVPPSAKNKYKSGLEAEFDDMAASEVSDNSAVMDAFMNLPEGIKSQFLKVITGDFTKRFFDG